jgi:translation initiation factor 3 subunit L
LAQAARSHRRCFFFRAASRRPVAQARADSHSEQAGTMNADLEDTIEVDDLPNFRLGGTMQFDVDASGTGAAAEVYTAETVELPEVIRLFAVYFQKQLREGNVYEVHSIYESTFNKLTDRFYKSSPWPNAETIAPLVGGDATFLLLYKELYFRHIYSKLQPTVEQRVASWQNYCDIFDTLLSADEPLALQLPNQ